METASDIVKILLQEFDFSGESSETALNYLQHSSFVWIEMILSVFMSVILALILK